MPPVDLGVALQGGGSHGAFTWGVLDRLLDEDDIRLHAVSGTNAGAVNAAALACGLAEGGQPGAQRRLSQVWRAVGRAGTWVSPPSQALWAGPPLESGRNSSTSGGGGGSDPSRRRATA